MSIDERYRQQVDLLVRTIPSVAAEPVFALKGGTAINLFIRDIPRLSVDIDLTYLPLRPRDEALINIDDALTRIGAKAIRARLGAGPCGDASRSGVGGGRQG